MSAAARRKVKDAVEASELLRRYAASGVSLSAWCAAEGIDWRSLSGYRNLGVEPLRLVEVAVSAPPPVPPPTLAPPAPTPRVYRLVVGAVQVEVGDDFQSDTLSRLLAVVSAC